jgi:purine-cytosine permease-like protein
MLALQPLFPIPIYFSILTGHPWWWLSWIIAVFPLGVRYFFTRRVISLTLFDVPILLFVCGILIGLIVAPDKGVAMGAVSSIVITMNLYSHVIPGMQKDAALKFDELLKKI